MVDGRLSYPKLWKAEHFKNDTATAKRFGCQILVPKADKTFKPIIDKEIKRIADASLKGKVPKSKDIPVKDGDGENGDEHSAGCWIVSANRAESQGRPQVVDQRKNPIDAGDNKLFAGYQCRFVLGIYKPKGYDIIACQLEIVQLLREDEVFGAGRVDTDVLPDVEDDEDL